MEGVKNGDVQNMVSECEQFELHVISRFKKIGTVTE